MSLLISCSCSGGLDPGSRSTSSSLSPPQAAGPLDVQVQFAGDSDQVLVLSEPEGISCLRFPGSQGQGEACGATFPQGTAVRLRAIGITCGLSWSAPCVSSAQAAGSVCQLQGTDGKATVSIAHLCTMQPSALLTVKVSGPGRVTGETAQIDCGGICAAAVASTTDVVLDARADPGAKFVGWGGACSGTGECRFHRSDPPFAVSAEFAR